MPISADQQVWCVAIASAASGHMHAGHVLHCFEKLINLHQILQSEVGKNLYLWKIVDVLLIEITGIWSKIFEVMIPVLCM